MATRKSPGSSSCILPPVILLQRRVLVGKRDDARNQILTIAGFEDGYSVGAPWIEVQRFRLPGSMGVYLRNGQQEQCRNSQVHYWRSNHKRKPGPA